MDEYAGRLIEIWYVVFRNQALLIETLADYCPGQFVIPSSFYFAIDEGRDISGSRIFYIKRLVTSKLECAAEGYSQPLFCI